MTSANPKAKPHQNFSSLFRLLIHWRATLWREFWNLFGCKMVSIQKHSFFWALLTRRPCAALALAANLKFVREVIAKRIIEMATKGERDPERLCNGAQGNPKIRPIEALLALLIGSAARTQKDLDGPK
jgi:hypothetical protein